MSKESTSKVTKQVKELIGLEKLNYEDNVEYTGHN